MPDLLSPAFYADFDGMHAGLRDLRREGPVWRDEPNGLWAVLGHQEVIDVERRADVFSSLHGQRAQIWPGEQHMLALDDPQHRVQRKIVSRGFTPGAVQRFGPLVDHIASELIDGFIGAGEVDLVDGLAAVLPARMTAHLLGFADDEWRSVKRWSECIMRLDATDDPMVMEEFLGAVTEFAPRLADLCEARRAEPQDDLISTWTAAGVDEELMVNETGLFISGGAETTRTVIARGLLEFTKHPDQWDALGDDPDLLPGAVEELIRWVTPLNNFFRTVSRPDSIGGVEVEEGDRVILLYPSANRDERVFDDPYTFDITREGNHHVAFGFGTHFCLGAPLARQTLISLFGQLTQRITDLRVVEPPVIEPNIFVGAVKSARLGFTNR